MWRYLLPIVMFGALVAIFARGLQLDPSYVPSPLIGKPVPEFTLPTLVDANRNLSDKDLLGNVSLVNVWATWCVGCRQEHGYLVELSRQTQVPIYGLNWKDDSDKAREWLQQLGNPYVASAVDLEGRVAIDFGVYGAPETFLIDANGTVLYKHLSPLTPEVWQQEFLPRIAQAKQ
jgi:cytochrome c biogenesis protein CcmG/thiol:disulfide interchange protein DsbE